MGICVSATSASNIKPNNIESEKFNFETSAPVPAILTNVETTAALSASYNVSAATSAVFSASFHAPAATSTVLPASSVSLTFSAASIFVPAASESIPSILSASSVHAAASSAAPAVFPASASFPAAISAVPPHPRAPTSLMDITLSRHSIAPHNVSSSFASTFALLKPSKGKPQKAAYGTDDGCLTCFAVKKGQAVVVFRTAPGPSPVTCVHVHVTPDGKDRIFFAVGRCPHTACCSGSA
jgi:hypothetical protein